MNTMLRSLLPLMLLGGLPTADALVPIPSARRHPLELPPMAPPLVRRERPVEGSGKPSHRPRGDTPMDRERQAAAEAKRKRKAEQLRKQLR